MSTLKEACKSRKGFTLIEVMVAVAISAFIMISLYMITDGVLRSREGLSSANTELLLANALELQMSRDIRMMSGDAVTNDNNSRARHELFTIRTSNSLTFGKAIPVNVSYFVDNSSYTLYREEFAEDMEYVMLIPLLDNVTEALVESFDGNEYTEGFNSARYIFRVSFKINNRHIRFVTGRAVSM
jgi:prepilin-type N-terminal cleavage/methylation domain-containing protein